jgi:hypothetical protein
MKQRKNLENNLKGKSIQADLNNNENDIYKVFERHKN